MKNFNRAIALRRIIMRTSLVFSMMCFFSLSFATASAVKAQLGLDKKIDISLKDVSFADFLKEIEKKTGVSFIYTNKEMISTRVSVNDKGKSARLILTPLLAKNRLLAIEEGMMVVLKKTAYGI